MTALHNIAEGAFYQSDLREALFRNAERFPAHAEGLLRHVVDAEEHIMMAARELERLLLS